MGFNKKTILLKQINDGFSFTGRQASAILKIITDNKTEVFLSLINTASVTDGDYLLYIVDEKEKLYKYDLKNNLSTFHFVLDEKPSIFKGVSAGIFFKSEEFFTPVLFNSELETIDLKRIKELIEIEENKLFNQNYEYDDDAVATENYYLKELDNAKEQLSNQIERIKNNISEEEIKEQKENEDCKNETPPISSQEQTTNYYDNIKKELDVIFLENKRENRLEQVIKESTFCKVNYSKDKYYVVGLIKENGNAKYICYGVPSKYSSTPPKELQGYCAFTPLSVFDLNGDGYFLMYQSALTGECIKFDN